MDWVNSKDRITEYIKRYRCVLLFVMAGICLMLIPEKDDAEVEHMPQSAEAEAELEDSLSQLLSMLAGAGNVQVLLTEEQGSCTYYQSDDVTAGSEMRTNTVLITEDDRSEAGLIRKVDSPVYRGAVVLCQGADNAQVRLSIVEAMKCATGLSADRISVLKMK